jgi:hypothetical protein
MKKRILMMLATILMICGTTAGLMSCFNDDNPVNNIVTSEDVVGIWYTEFDQAGVYGEGESAKSYAKTVLYGALNKDNTGMFICLFIDADGNAVDLGDTFLGAGCEYTVAPNGRVDIKLTGESEGAMFNPQWSMTYRDGQLFGKVLNDIEFTMLPITEALLVQYQEWMRQLGLGNDTEPDLPQSDGEISDDPAVGPAMSRRHDNQENEW